MSVDRLLVNFERELGRLPYNAERIKAWAIKIKEAHDKEIEEQGEELEAIKKMLREP